MAQPSRWYLFCCWLVILSLVGGPLAGQAKPAAPVSSTGVQNRLQDDPLQAVPLLVEQVYGADEAAAQAAVGELLRRAGIPLVSIDGPVEALPDELALEDAALYIELTPDLTRAVRQGDFYTPTQLAGLLHEIGYPADALSEAVLVAGLGQWGKAADAPAESRAAATTVRALAGRRLQVLYLGADLSRVEFDPLQAVLILAHATSRVRPVAPKPAASLWDRFMGVTPVKAQAGPCDGLEKALAPSGQVQETVVTFTKDKLGQAWKEFLFDEAGRESFDRVKNVYDKGSAVLNVLLLMLGAQIDVSDDKGGLTHFKHREGDRSRHVQVRALAYFDSNIAKKKIGCYKLAGIDVPPPGPMSGYKVRWSLDQAVGENYQGKYLTAVQSDSHKIGGCGTCGETTGNDGRSSVQLYPPVERNPGTGRPVHGMVRVTASLDKADFPFKLSDLLSLKNPMEFAGSKTWDLAISALSRAGLPSKSRAIKVEYHGSEIYISRGKSNLFLFYVTAPVELDVYTCEGLGGKWQGRGGLGGDTKTILGSAAESITGTNIQEGVSYIQNFTFTIDPEAEESAFDIMPAIKMTGVMEIDRTLIAARKAVVIGDRVGQPVGEIGLYMNGASLTPISFFGSTVFPVYRMPADPRCPPGGYYFETIP